MSHILMQYAWTTTTHKRSVQRSSTDCARQAQPPQAHPGIDARVWRSAGAGGSGRQVSSTFKFCQQLPTFAFARLAAQVVVFLSVTHATWPKGLLMISVIRVECR